MCQTAKVCTMLKHSTNSICAFCVGVTIRILNVPAKPVGNLPLRMFQRYFARLANALKECPGVVANDLYSSHLIARETVDKVHFTSGLTPHDKATILLMAVEPSIADSKSDKALKKLCGILSKHPNMKKLSKQIVKRYGKLDPSAHLRWISDTQIWILSLLQIYGMYRP